jgi:hypothetical protein
MRHRWNAVLASIALVTAVMVPAGTVRGEGNRGDGSARWQFSPEQVRAITSIVVSGYAAAGNPGISVGIWVPGEGGWSSALWDPRLRCRC